VRTRPSLVLVVAAFDPELAWLTSRLGASRPGQRIESQIAGVDIMAAAVGIGLPAATVGTGMRIADLRPDGVVLVGTCGAYPESEIRLGDVVVARTVRLACGSVAGGNAEWPESMQSVLDADRAMARALVAEGCRLADVATTLGITVDDATAERVARATGAGAEHLEAFGVVTATSAAGVPCAVVLGVANQVGARAREQWRANHLVAAEAAAARVISWLEKGAEGMGAAGTTSVRA
jgi:futalosine hydrolase